MTNGGRGRVLVLWDVDHTLIENGGVSKANYALAFEILTGRPAQTVARTDGRTDVDIMAGLLADNGAEPPADHDAVLAALAEAGRRNAEELRRRGHSLPGAAECLERLAERSDVINSVLTGNIEDNARVKLGTFGLDKWIDFSVGAFGAEHRVRSRLVAIAQAKAAERCGFDTEREVTLLVGDTVRDVMAGRDGGARVIAVATGLDSQEDLREAGADVVLATLEDVDAFCEALEEVRVAGPAKVDQ
jgi:phosphoglycolate phosphatase-like HAD superfamily hydrolase